MTQTITDPRIHQALLCDVFFIGVYLVRDITRRSQYVAAVSVVGAMPMYRCLYNTH